MNKELIRVGIQFTNFNYTENELRQLKQLLIDEPFKNFFVWSNVKGYNNVWGNTQPNKCLTTSKDLLLSVIKHKRVKIGFTVTPNLKFVEPKLPSKYIDSVVYKFVLNNQTKNTTKQVLDYCQKDNLNLLVIPQKFRCNNTFNKYTHVDEQKHYTFKGNYKRLTQNRYLEFIQEIKQQYQQTWPCDIAEKGCLYCLNCYRINNLEPITNIQGIDLLSSGSCQHNCPDCYAKYNSYRTKGKINYNKLKGNTKTLGKKKNVLNKQRELILV